MTRTLSLCTYSRSDLLADAVLRTCPIELTAAEHDHCPCRRREIVPKGRVELRVLTCTWPRVWNGREIMNPPAFAEATRASCARKVEMERIMKKPTTTADPPTPAAPAPLTCLTPDAEVTAVVVPDPPKGSLVAMPAGATVTATPPLNLAAALARAQQKCQPARKDARNSHHGYRYASAEAVITEAKKALADTGLALVPVEQSLERAEGGGYELVRKFLLIHESGQSITLSCAWPVIEERGRPVDKATAISSTASLAYMLRDLLLMPRVADETDLAARKDATAPVSGRALLEQRKREQEAAQAAPSAAPPSATAAPSAPVPAAAPANGSVTEQQLGKLVSLRKECLATLAPADPEAWWRDCLARYSVTTARSLSEDEARKLIGELAHQLTCHDVEAGLGESTGRS